MSSKKKSVVILGAGPAGLSAAIELLKDSYDVTIVEREAVIGGISKTIKYKGFRFDVGGHRFFTKNDEVEKLWKEALGKDFRRTKRLSRIYYKKKFFMYPIELKDTLKKAGIATSLACIFSYLRYRIAPVRPEESFSAWVTNRFGKKLFLMFFKSYTEKTWGISTDELSAEWAAQRIKGLSLWVALTNALFKPKVKVKTLIEEFKYPKYGPGQMYEKFANIIKKRGGKIILNTQVKEISCSGKKVNGIVVSDESGKTKKISADYVITTLPLPKTIELISPKLELAKKVGKILKFRDFISVNLIVKQKNIFPDTWIYIHDPSVKMGRIQNFKNWSRFMTPNQNLTPIGCEYFCNQGDELWNMKNSDLIKLASSEIDQMGLSRKDLVLDGMVYRMREAYPIYMGQYQSYIKKARQEIEKIQNLYAAGRGGMFRYNNMDHSILSGLYAARLLMGKEGYDPWEVNTEDDYHEKK